MIEITKKYRDRIAGLTYEQSLEQLDILINKLQNDDISVDDLHETFLQANIYIEHCEKLLNNLEQEIQELDLDDAEEE